MQEVRATIAIVRHHMGRRFALDFAMQFVIVGAIAYVFAHNFGTLYPVLLCGALAATNAAERAHAAELRHVSFFAMPLFGRQLARAHAIVAVLVALSSVFRDGLRAALYVGIAIGAVATIALSALVPEHGLEIALTLAVVEGFFALRAFGETLARYDPV
jgi:hypothetical protein